MGNQYLITAEDLYSRLSSPVTRILDCRFDLLNPDAGRQQYLAGHIPAAVYADLDKDLAGPVSEETGRHPLPEIDALAAFLAGAGISKQSQVVVYDSANGALAARAWWLLRWLGHERVSVLEGGIAAWTEKNLPMTSGDEHPGRAEFAARPRPGMVLPLAEILEREVAVGSLGLLDAREPQRFRGEIEPIDPVAGHIPGARNLPFNAAIDEKGRWKAPAELREMFEAVLGDATADEFSVMCGSGVTACHVILSALLAGLDEPRLYVGSWSEWIRDPARPIASGAT